MKYFLWFVCFLLNGAALAETKPIKFVYIHGSNFNSECHKNLFEEQAQALHREVKKSFKLNEANPALSKHFLQGGQYSIASEPLAFYWGDLPKPEVDFLKRQLNLTDGTALFAQKARVLASTVLHDAVWLEKSSRRAAVLDRLVKDIGKKEHFVLLGHSGGSLVAYQFITQRISFLSLEDYCHGIAINELFLDRGSPEDRAIAQINENLKANFQTCLENTLRFRKLMELEEDFICTDGAAYIGLVTIDPKYSAILQPNLAELLSKLESDPRQLIKTKRILEQTCVPKERLRGLVTFGSPIPIFGSVYMSQIYDEKKTIGARYQFIDSVFDYFLKYLNESGSFWLHLNHLDDPVGIAIDDKKLQELSQNKSSQSLPNSGFIFNASSFFQKYFRGEQYFRPSRFLNPKDAHLWYWNKPKEFAHYLIEAYTDGYHRRTTRITLKKTQDLDSQ